MANPDGVSGPGKLSKRTDRGTAQKLRDLPDAQYGEAATYRDQQKQAPLAQTPTNVPGRPASGGTGPQVTPMGAPSERPDEPVTAGAAAGPGPGPEALGLSPPPIQQWQSARDLVTSLVAQHPDSDALNYLAQRLQGRF